ncbi:MAG: hypothetical protein HYY20_07805 [Candidatus Tectomicrobia bacterium]|uniref:Uncharacterized protein n=1 Tax=Tectimicrobiota bacterium TaxID=2528274 RepID=A0A932CNT2_UNCTE|nr:hypothetical protein [Candidatus Tectomicrobia bacterium]
METISQRNYSYQAAGRFWLVPELYLTRMPDGTLAIMQDEIDRIHRAIANEICGSPDSLTSDELEFLCDVTLTSFTEVAESLDVHKSTLTKWRKSLAHLLPWTSLLLKKRFWFKIFGDQLRNQIVRFEQVEDDATFLAFARNQAIEEELAVPIRKSA